MGEIPMNLTTGGTKHGISELKTKLNPQGVNNGISTTNLNWLLSSQISANQSLPLEDCKVDMFGAGG